MRGIPSIRVAIKLSKNGTNNIEKGDCNDKFVKIIHHFELVVVVIVAAVLGAILIVITKYNLIFGAILELFILVPALLIYPFYVYRKTIKLISEIPESGADQEHHAIIIAHLGDPKSGKFTFLDYLSGADLLIEKFKAKSKNYKVYEVNKKGQVIPIILDEKTTHLWIFGHGMRKNWL